MRAGVAIFFLAATALPCIICKHTRDELFTKSAKKNLSDAIKCFKSLGLSKCITAYGVWKAESALEPQEGSRNSFIWLDYANHTDEDLYSRLCDDTEKLLRDRPLIMNFGERYLIKMKSTSNKTLNFDVIENKHLNTGRTSMKKMTKMFYQALPLLILPGLVMSAVLPFFLPTLKMATLATGMLNNMALAGAVFSLLRNNAFNDNKYYEKKVIYVNAGYVKHKYDPLVEAPSEPMDEVVGTNFDTQYSTEVTHDVKDYHLIGLDPNTGISYPFNEDWLKNTANNPGKVKNVQIIGEVPSEVNDWRKPNLNWPQHNNR